MGMLIKYQLLRLKKFGIALLAIMPSLALISALSTLISDILEKKGYTTQISFLVLDGMSVFISFISYALIIGCVIVAGIAGLYIYYKSVFTDEGYLTQVLPISTDALLFGNILTTLIFTIATGLYSIFCLFLHRVFLVLFKLDNFNFDASDDPMLLIDRIQNFLTTANVALSVLAMGTVLFFVITITCSVFHRKRLLLGSLIYVGCNLLVSTISDFLSTLVLSQFTFEDYLEHVSEILIFSTLAELAFSLVVCIIMYFSTRAILIHKSNLE